MGCGKSKNELNKSIIKKFKSVQPVVDTDEPERGNNLKMDPSPLVIHLEDNIKDNYSLSVKVGESAFGVVRVAVHKPSGQKRAVKSIQKSKFTEIEGKARFMREINILRQMDHANIVKFYECYEDDTQFHIVTEYIPGGELFDYIIQTRSLSEPVAAYFMSQILSAIAYCHDKGIIHRDIKPENLLLDREGPEAIIKLIDFGTSGEVQPELKTQKMHGNVLYTAPEIILNNEYNEKCDIWSCGIVLFILLSGKAPFFGKRESEITNKIIAGDYNTNGPEWHHASTSSIKLLNRMLETNPYKRISAKEALQDSFFNKNSKRKSLTSNLSLENLQNFHIEQKLQQVVLSFMASTLMTKEESKQLYDNFRKIDKNGDGKLSAEELIEAYNKIMHRSKAVEEVEKIMQSVDTNQSGFIDYSEFVTACLQKEYMLNTKNLEIAFKSFDRDGSGKITVEELKEMLGLVGEADENVASLIRMVDENGDGTIDLSEFKNMMIKCFGGSNL